MSDSLTGVWDGTFVQRHVGMVTFLATLIESGGALTGNVTEPCTVPGCPVSTHNASIAGHRSGSAAERAGQGRNVDERHFLSSQGRASASPIAQRYLRSASKEQFLIRQ